MPRKIRTTTSDPKRNRNSNKPITSKKIKLVSKNLPRKKVWD